MRATALGLVALAMATASPAAAQFPPERLENLKVLPKAMPVRALLDTMRSFTRALGVRCSYCHVGQEGQNLSTYDFKSDEKPAKEKARTMMRMVTAINAEHLPKLPERRQPPIAATCATCHRGIAEPRPLPDVIMATYDAAGPDSAVAMYRALRQRYYGRAAYDFGEVALADVAAALREKDRLADAVRFHRLNVEVSPNSAFALRQAAEAELTAGDTAAARAHLERVLTINPNDQQTKRALDALGPKP
jgi:tetratricopeptide (TPR) repeat protein